MPGFSLMVAETISQVTEGLSATCACKAGRAKEECAYELFRSSQSIFMQAEKMGEGKSIYKKGRIKEKRELTSFFDTALVKVFFKSSIVS